MLFQERQFRFDELDPEEQDSVYNIFKQEYEKVTGEAWDRNLFDRRVANWVFFGDTDGFVAVRPQKGGLMKLNATAGNRLNQVRGIKELLSLSEPTWGLVTKPIADMAVKLGFKVYSKAEVEQIAPHVQHMFQGTPTVSDDGAITYTDQNLGKTVTKYLIGNGKYNWWLWKMKILNKMGSILGLS